MKINPLTSRLFAVCAFFLSSFVTAHAFEGRISMTMTSGKNTLPITYFIKEPHMRAEMTAAADKKGNKMTMTMLVDWKARQVTYLMKDQKMYFVSSIPQLDTQETAKQIDFKPTGRTEKIAGYDAQEYAGISEGKRTEVWVTKGLGGYLMGNMGGKPGRKTQSAQWEAFMREGGFFPLRMIQRQKEGAPEKIHMEVTSVEKTSEPDSLFLPPADFRRFEMPDMGGLLKGLIPGRR